MCPGVYGKPLQTLMCRPPRARPQLRPFQATGALEKRGAHGVCLSFQSGTAVRAVPHLCPLHDEGSSEPIPGRKKAMRGRGMAGGAWRR